MPDLTIDTSSYPKPGTPRNALEIASDYGKLKQQQQQIESGGLSIDKQKLDLLTQRYGQINKEMAGLVAKKDLNQGDVVGVFRNNVQSKFIPPDMAATEIAQIPPQPKGMSNEDYSNVLREHIQKKIFAADQTMTALNWHAGQFGIDQNGATRTPVVTSAKPGFGGMRAVGLPIQNQPDVNTPTFGPGGPQALGPQSPQLPAGAAPAPGGIPGQFQPAPLPVGPVTAPGVTGPSSNFGGTVTGATVGPNTADSNLPVQPMQPRGPITGPPPNFVEGQKAYAQDQELATQKLTAIKPILQALPLMKGLISSGPGTATLTSTLAGLSNAGLIPKGLTDKVAAQQEVIKKLAQYVSSSPVGQRSDAAQTLAEAGSPSPKVQVLPALIKLSQDAIALDRVQAARPGAFKGNDYSKYGSHRSTFPANMDERVFKLDAMEPEERDALLAEMGKKRNTFEGKKFFKSLDVVDDQGMIDTGGGK